MRIGGIQRVSLIDYPGQISAIIFTQGCNFRCPYCHNPELVDPVRFGEMISEGDVFSFLEKRRGKIDAVTITGGEPTIQDDLEEFLWKIKKMGYRTKIDTNGSNPALLRRLIRKGMADYVAMDVKGPFEKYNDIAGVSVNIGDISKSVDILLNSSIEHEFRTTVVRSQLDPADIISVARILKKAGSYVLQPFVPNKTLDDQFLEESSYSAEEFESLQNKLQQKKIRIIIR